MYRNVLQRSLAKEQNNLEALLQTCGAAGLLHETITENHAVLTGLRGGGHEIIPLA